MGEINTEGKGKEMLKAKGSIDLVSNLLTDLTQQTSKDLRILKGAIFAPSMVERALYSLANVPGRYERAMNEIESSPWLSELGYSKEKLEAAYNTFLVNFGATYSNSRSFRERISERICSRDRIISGDLVKIISAI